MDNLWNGILGGLKKCREIGKIPATIGIDTWAVDFVLLDENGAMIGDAVAYRDGRTQGADKIADALIPAADLYARAGIQKQIFNTIYQLLALQKEHPEQLGKADAMLMIPDYFGYLLTGVKKQEYTNATSTNLVNAAAKTWDMDLIRRLGLPEKLFTELSMPGTVVGNLTEEIPFRRHTTRVQLSWQFLQRTTMRSTFPAAHGPFWVLKMKSRSARRHPADRTLPTRAARGTASGISRISWDCG